MTTNEFKPFATGANANVTPQAEWATLPALFSGFQSGKASSAQVNKALRQASFIAAALAQFVSEKTAGDVLDDGDLDGFVGKLTSGFAAQYLSRENPFGDIAQDGDAAITAALKNLRLGDVVKLPDFTSGSNWRRTPDGVIEQWGVSTLSDPTTGNAIITFPFPFPNSCDVIIPIEGTGSETERTGIVSWGVDFNMLTTKGVTVKSSTGSELCRYFARGR